MSKIDVASLPSIFVIGDSISVQYGPYLSKYLEPFFVYHRKRGAEDAFANLDLPVGANGGDSSVVLAYLEANDRHSEIPYVDYLLVNCGLHDIKTNPESGTKQVDIDSYRRNLERIVSCSSSLCGEFVWIRTTPCDEAVHNKPGMEFHRYRSDCDAYNAVADGVMSERGVESIDLFSFTETLGPELYADHVHFPEHIQQKQAAFIAGWLIGHHAEKG